MNVIQEVICPNCAKPSKVNVVKGGWSETQCQKCNWTIRVKADRNGGIIKIETGSRTSCFIVTACLNEVIESGAGEYELAVLRQYRDSYVRSLKGGEDILNHYYFIAPSIVAAIRKQSTSREIFREIYTNYANQE